MTLDLGWRIWDGGQRLLESHVAKACQGGSRLYWIIL